MFITSESKFDDSLLFLMAARDAIGCAVSESSVERKKELKNFIHNEATDYQIMSLLVTGELPEDKFNPVGEAALFSLLKEKLMYNFESLSKVVRPSIIHNILQEVDTIFPYQSSKPLMEYAMMLRQEEFDPTAVGSDGGATGRAVKSGLKTAGKYWKKKGAAAGDELSKGAKAMGKGFADAGKEVGSTIKNSEVGKGAAAMGKGFADAGKEVASTVKDGVTNLQQKMAAKDLAIQRAAQPAAMRDAGEKIANAQQTGFDKALKGDIAASRPGFFDTLKQKASKGFDAAKEFLKTPAGKTLAGAAVAAVIIYASYKLYKNFLSKAARACAGAGAGKAQCMAQQKVKAYMAQIADLKASSKACSKTSNPQKCQAAIANKIRGLQAKAAKAKG